MREEKKFREYLIDYDYCPMTVFCKPSFDDIHVVEIAALEAERAKSKKLVEALENIVCCTDCCPINHCVSCQGEAEQALKEYGASDE